MRAYLRPMAAALGQGPLRPRARPARAGRPQGRRGAGARGLALRRLLAGRGKAGARRLRRISDARRPQGAHGPPPLREGRHRRRPARGRSASAATSRRSPRPASPCSSKGGNKAAARCRAGRRPRRHRLQVRPHPDAAAHRPARRGRGADARPSPTRSTTATISTSGGSSAACWPASCSTTATPRTPIWWCATPRRRRSDNYRAEHQFTAGWIALRFLHDPATAYAHFKHGRRRQRQSDLARARRLLAGPRGRGHEPAAGGARALPGGRALSDRLLRPDRPRQGRARRTHAQSLPRAVQRAARQGRAAPTWCARPNCSTPSMPAISPGRMMADLGDKSDDVGVLAMLAELTAKYQRRPRHAAARQARARPRLCARPRRLPDHRRAGATSRSARRSNRPSSIRSCGRRAGSIRRPSRAPTRSA